MKTETKFSKRPKWAKPLDAKTWRHLFESQGRPPTLANLRSDVADGHCLECRRALRMVEGR